MFSIIKQGMGEKAAREAAHGNPSLCPARHKSHGESPRWEPSPSGWTGTGIEPRQLESRDPNHIPERGETKNSHCSISL